jgi:hypothetical protein
VRITTVSYSVLTTIIKAIGLIPVSLGIAGLLIAWSLKGMFIIAGTAILLTTAFGALQKQVREIA